MTEQVEDGGIVQRHAIDIQLLATGGLDGELGVIDKSERLEAEKVQLEQADLFDLVLGPLRRDLVALFCAAVQRRELDDRFRRDDDAGGMGRGVARQPLEPLADIEHFLDARLLLVGLLQRRNLLQRLVDGDLGIWLYRYQLGDSIDVGVGNLQDAADVADDGAGRHCSEGDDLGDILAAIFLSDVIDDPLAPAEAEVYVDVRHADALAVQETLEDQLELQGIDVGYRHAVGDE